MNDLTLQRIQAPNPHTPDYQPLILPFILSSFQQGDTEEGYWVASEARLKGRLIGLSLACVYFINQTAQLYSLMVEEAYQRQGIGLALFRFLETSLIEQDHIRAFGFEYEKDSPAAPALEKILSHQGWSPPLVYLIRLHFDAYQFNPSWLYLPYRLPPDMTLFSWQELTAEEKEQILFDADQGRFLPSLSPFRKEDIDLETSVGLRYKGRVIGWSITRRPNPQTILYSILYIEKNFQFSGCGIRLLVESISLHAQRPIPRAIFEINLQEIDPSWRRFVKKRLLPLTDKVERMKWAFHSYV